MVTEQRQIIRDHVEQTKKEAMTEDDLPFWSQLSCMQCETVCWLFLTVGCVCVFFSLYTFLHVFILSFFL